MFLTKKINRYLDRTGLSHVRAAKGFVAGRKFSKGDFSWSPLSQRNNWLLKRAVDVSVGIIGLPALIPLTIILAPLIKMESSGPVFYKDIREGKDGQPFNLYKFRSMRLNTDPPKSYEEYEMLKLNGDPRVTTVGNFIRKYGLDEAPQFINLLTGELTLIGARAVRTYFLDSIPDPGQTGWRSFRVKIAPSILPASKVLAGRGQLKADELIDLEMYYFAKWSLWLEIKLLVRGLAYVLSGRHQ